MVQKTLTIARHDFVEAMSRLIVESGLPYSMLCDIFKDAAQQMDRMENEQYQKDKQEYEKALKEQEEQNNE